MMLLEKYRPKTIYDCEFGLPILRQLLHMANYDDIPHIILSGPPGSGKKTLTNFFLEAIYDSSVNNLTKCIYTINGSSTKKKVEILRSDYHIIIEPTNTNHDKYILQEIIKQYAMSKVFSFLKMQRKFKTIIIHNVENLSNNSQSALRRTMELYAGSCRFIMLCNNLSKIIDPLKSRCRLFCVPLPSKDYIRQTFTKISILENIVLDPKQKNKILNECDNDLKKAINKLDAIKYNNKTDIMLDDKFNDIVGVILSIRTVSNKNVIKTFMEIRDMIYSLVITNIDGPKIMMTIMDKLIDIINDDDICTQIIRLTSELEHNLANGRREIAPIDSFINRILKLVHSNRDKITIKL